MCTGPRKYNSIVTSKRRNSEDNTYGSDSRSGEKLERVRVQECETDKEKRFPKEQLVTWVYDVQINSTLVIRNV